MCLSSLGYYVGLMCNAVNAEQEMYGDIVAFGAPSECGHSVRTGAYLNNVRLMREILEDSGYSMEEFREELDRRVTARFAYQSGIYLVMDDYQAYVDEQTELRDKRRRRNQSRLPGTRLNGYRYAA